VLICHQIPESTKILVKQKTLVIQKAINTTLFIAIVMLAMIVSAGCINQAPRSYAPYGTVRSVWIETHGQNMRTVIALAPDNDPRQLITIEFNSVEPALWKNLHAKMVVERTSDFDGGYCPYDGRPFFKIAQLEQLS